MPKPVIECATQRTASAHTLHMPKPVITLVFKVLCNGIHSARQWTASVLRHVHILLNNSNGKTPKSENHAQNVLKSEMLGMVISFVKLHRNFRPINI